jgi:arabinose-5-phosphate isomerase
MRVVELFKQVVQTEAEALSKLVDQIDESFAEAIEIIQKCQGKVVVTGVGKSGIVGKKIAASLSSTGTPAFFVHACEAVHGDSGMIEERDVVVMISNSGETREVLDVVPVLDQIGCKRIAITSNHESTLAKLSDVSLAYNYEKEADHLNLAPTTSTTLTMVIGDALAVALSILKEFSEEDFHRYHPGGSLGAKLSDLQNKGDR